MLIRIVLCFAVLNIFDAGLSGSFAKGMEVNPSKAIEIAYKVASDNNFSTKQTDIEIIKVKKGLERGPIRFSWLMNNFQKEEIQVLLSREFWIVFFFPQKLLDGNHVLGGGFCVLLDLYSGELLYSFHDQ
jgi:hypothetical protein